MGNIVLLDDLTINKIAAGEVVERPASVIKEMVENSIDAGATNITIEIKNGGISYIRVTDNGKGMLKDDLELAFERHATSKIRNADDLNVVKSMGFRGEALASIAAIANVELCSKTENDEVGSRIVVEGGNVLEQGECACPKGTTITVKNLFFNTPVRYKFLKKDYTESGYIEDAVSRLALINTNIAFKLINTGKTVIQTNGDGNINNVIFNIYGKDIAKAVMPVKFEYEGIDVSGVVGRPEIARSNRGNQIFYVNKRYVKDKVLSSATEKAFKGLLPMGKYGFLVLNIELDPVLVDVNVHPAKLEVRFQDENAVFKAVYNAVKNTLLKADLIEKIENVEEYDNTKNKAGFNMAFKQMTDKTIANEHKISDMFVKKPTMTIEDVVAEKIEKEKQEQTNKTIEEIPVNNLPTENKEIEEKKADNILESVFLSKKPNEDNIEKSTEDTTKIENINNIVKNNIPIENNEAEKIANIPINGEIGNNLNAGEVVTKLIENKIEKETKPQFNFDDMYSKVFGTTKKDDEAPEENNELISASSLINENISLYENMDDYEAEKGKNFRLIGVAFNTYIIIEIEKDLYIIDQQNAHARIIFEKIKENYYSDETKDSQLLLLPDVIELSHKEMDIARDNKDKFEKAGFQLEEFGENTIKLIGAPTMCVDLNTRDLFLEILDEINTVARTETREVEEKFLLTIASKTAIRKNTELSTEEINSMIKQLLELENPFINIADKPIAIKISKEDLEKKFARRK